VSKHTCQYWQA